ncbi:MAG: hypothetical protein JKY51_04030, partial [Opitutaceae bacterium]|nr:hypothetical protein [Opitutaceae bacterium]
NPSDHSDKHNPIQKLRSGVFNLSVACPYTQGNPQECPLCKIRKRPLKDRYIWVQSLSAKKAEQILTHHKCCLEDKENGTEQKETKDYTQRAIEADEIGDKGLAVQLEDMIRDESAHSEETERMLRDWPL